MIKNILTIRHGEAEHQVSSLVWKQYTNEQIPLSKLGRQQAEECGNFLASLKLPIEKTVLISSPFVRALQTKDQIVKKIPDVPVKTNDLLVEQNFGLFIGLTTKQCYETYPELARLYDLHVQCKGEFFVTPPQGESKADVAKRASSFIEEITSCYQDSSIENLIIVSHCVFNRALNQVLLKQTPEWFLAQKQQENCSVKRFSYNGKEWQDHGFIFVPRKKSQNISIVNTIQNVTKYGGR